jgi:hypothetical protein
MMMFLNSFYFEIFLEKKKKEKLGFITQLRNKYNVVSQKQPLCLEFTYGGILVVCPKSPGLFRKSQPLYMCPL